MELWVAVFLFGAILIVMGIVGGNMKVHKQGVDIPAIQGGNRFMAFAVGVIVLLVGIGLGIPGKNEPTPAPPSPDPAPKEQKGSKEYSNGPQEDPKKTSTNIPNPVRTSKSIAPRTQGTSNTAVIS